MSVIKSILVCCFIGLVVNAHAMHVQRILGELVQECDRKTWKKISDPEKDVDEGELVAVKHHNFDWTYGKVTEKPGDNFMGMVSFRPDYPYRSFAVHFSCNVRKLVTQAKAQNKEMPAKHENVD